MDNDIWAFYTFVIGFILGIAIILIGGKNDNDD